MRDQHAGQPADRPFTVLDGALWSKFAGGRPVARITKGVDAVGERLGAPFGHVDDSGVTRSVLILQLGSGDELAIASCWWEHSSDLALVQEPSAFRPPHIALAAFLHATGYPENQIIDLTPATDKESLDDAASLLLNTELLLPVTADDTVPVLMIGDMSFVPVLHSDHAKRDRLPPGCETFKEIVGHQLADILPQDDSFHVHVEPSGQIIPLALLRVRSHALVTAANAFHAGELDANGVLTVFRKAVVYCVAGKEPGFLTYPGKPRLIPVFSSLNLLAESAGLTAWFSTTGLDIINLTPDGYDLVIDPDSPHALQLDTAGCLKPGTS